MCMQGRCSERHVKSLIRKEFPKYGYVFGSWYEADRIVSKTRRLPLVCCLLPTGGEIDIVRGRTFYTEEIAVAFIDKVERDADGDENCDAYERMREAAERFIRVLNASDYFQPVSNVSYSVIYERLSTIVTGVMVTMRLTNREGIC